VKALTTLPGLATGVALCVVAPAANQMLRAADSELTPAQSDYLEQCGGCHGIQGNTAPAPVPVLRARVGYFMCTQAGRRYLIRLPNVSYARVDDESLADMMNFVVFGLGAPTAPANARGFTAEEVRELRSRPMLGSEVEVTRKLVVEELIRSCGAPADLRLTYPGESPEKLR
jgi:hypothetical protein